MGKIKVLIVVDMQNDFINEKVLGTKEAQGIVPNVVKKIQDYTGQNVISGCSSCVVYTMDTHDRNYLQTQEGRKLPVEHCIYPSDGWMLNEEVAHAIGQAKGFQNKTMSTPLKEFKKSIFGSFELANTLKEEEANLELIELVGVCTGICVISNAIILKTAMPEVPVIVDASACACVTPESHRNALETMKMCQIDIINE